MAKKHDLSLFPKAVHFRKMAGLSVSELARMLGGHPSISTIRRLENGLPISSSSVFRLANALNSAIREQGNATFSVDEEIERFIPGSSDSRDPDSPDKESAERVVRENPGQSSIIKFVISQNRIALAPSQDFDDDQNDWDSLTTISEEMRGPATYLNELYKSSKNTPQSEIFQPVIDAYSRELNKDIRSVNFTVLYVRGQKILAAKEASEAQIRAGEWPPFEPREQAELVSFCELHKSLMLRSSDGAKLVNEAFVFEATPQQIDHERNLYQELGEAIASDHDLVDAETAQFIRDATRVEVDDPQVSRSLFLAFSTTTSLLSITTAGAVFALSGSLAGTLVSVPVAWLVLKTVEKTDGYAEITKSGARKIDKLSKTLDDRFKRIDFNVFERMGVILKRKLSLLRQLSLSRRDFNWLNGVIGFIESKKGERKEVFDSEGEILDIPVGWSAPCSVVAFVAGFDPEHSVFGKLAHELDMPFYGSKSEIEAATNMTAEEILARDGISFFAHRILQIVDRLRSGEPSLITIPFEYANIFEGWGRWRDEISCLVVPLIDEQTKGEAKYEEAIELRKVREDLILSSGVSKVVRIAVDLNAIDDASFVHRAASAIYRATW